MNCHWEWSRCGGVLERAGPALIVEPATAVRLHVTHGALTEMRLVTTVALQRRRNHTPSHANCLPDAYRVYYSLSLPRSASKPNSLAKPCWARVSFERTRATRLGPFSS